MFFLLAMAFITLGSLQAADVSESLSYDADEIAVVNKFPSMLAIRFDVEGFKTAVPRDAYRLWNRDMLPDVVTYQLKPEEQKKLVFYKLVYDKKGKSSEVLSTCEVTVTLGTGINYDLFPFSFFLDPTNMPERVVISGTNSGIKIDKE